MTDAAPQSELPAFKGLRQVLEHLRGQGYTLAQSTIYEHHKKGFLLADSDGSFSRKAVEKYARVYLRKPGQGKDQVSGSTAESKARDEARLTKERADLLALKRAQLAGELVPRDFAVSELAKRALVLKHDLRNLAAAQARNLIKAALGDPARAPEVILTLQEAFDELLDRYAQGVSLVPLVPDPAEGGEAE